MAIKKNNKFNLQQLVEKIDWMMIAPTRAPWKLADDAVAVGFFSSKKNETVNKVKIRIGKDVIEKMKWNTGDKICVYQDPDHLLTFKLVRTEAGKGYNLSKENPGFCHHINFTWNHKELVLQEKKCTEVTYHIHKNNLIIFKVGSTEESEISE
jgi:hypothetical protein